MITAIREVRRAKGLTLADVAARCDPPTTAQSIGRLETGMRTVSVDWLNRIAVALDVSTADLVTLPGRPTLPVVATLGSDGAQALSRPATISPPAATPGAVALTVTASVGDYRAGDQIWCDVLAPDAFAAALNRDILVPRPGGRFIFGRLIARDPGMRLQMLPPGARARQQIIGEPLWLACAIRLVRLL